MRVSTNKVRQRIREGKTAFAVGLHLGEPAIVEMIGLGGFDAVFIDMENSQLDLLTVEELIRAAEIVDIAPVVRVPQLDPVMVRRVLDLGAQGITIPHVRSRQDAEQAVQAARYHPLGERGVSPASRAVRYGAVSWDEYARAANESVVVSMQVEDRHGLENLEDIASVKGVDLVAIGPSDLSESLGIRQPNDPRLRSIVEDIARKLKRVANAKMAFPYNHRMLQATPHDFREWGVSYSNVGPLIERVLLQHFQETITQLRADMEKVDASRTRA